MKTDSRDVRGLSLAITFDQGTVPWSIVYHGVFPRDRRRSPRAGNPHKTTPINPKNPSNFIVARILSFLTSHFSFLISVLRTDHTPCTRSFPVRSVPPSAPLSLCESRLPKNSSSYANLFKIPFRSRRCRRCP